MKLLQRILLVSFLFISFNSFAFNDSDIIGKTEDQVKLILGKSIGRVEIGDELILTYTNAKVSYADGKAVEVSGFTPTGNTPPTPSVVSSTPSAPPENTNALSLKFIAVDGTSVDLSEMKGKVVLIDFWATWCGPCVGEIPHVVEAYKKYHDKGFEIVGISLDRSKEKLMDFTQKNGMTWPQYFDGQGWKNQISSANGIHSIPAMWLIDKNGNLVSKDARQGLDAQLAKLLE
jgi:thiol-disulfide isomerase/thioredoxin